MYIKSINVINVYIMYSINFYVNTKINYNNVNNFNNY